MTNAMPLLTGRSALRTGMTVCAVATALLLLPGVPAATSDRPVDPAGVPALQEPPLTSYRAYRTMHVRNDRFNQESWLECWTELTEHGFAYQIVSERGSESLRDKVLRTLLRREQEIIAAGDAARADLSPANYDFSQAVAASGGERQIQLTPKRKDVLLVNGRMVLSPDGGDLLRVEGRLAKNPSFWTSLVDVVRGYGRVNGVRVPLYTQTTAKVKLAGTSTMDVRYDYVRVNGQVVTDAGRQLLASAAVR